MARISVVHDLQVNVLLLSSTVSVGDSASIAPISQSIAVQREVPAFLADEGDFARYPIFSRPAPQPIVKEKVRMSVINASPFIQVNGIRVLAISAASVLKIGFCGIVDAETRIKHFRQLISSDTDPEPPTTPKPAADAAVT